MSNATKPVASFRELKVFYPRDRSLDKYEDECREDAVLWLTFEDDEECYFYLNDTLILE